MHNGKAFIFGIQDDAGWAHYLTSGLQDSLLRKGVPAETFVGFNKDAKDNDLENAQENFDLSLYKNTYYFVYNINRRPTLTHGDDLFKRFCSPVLTHVIDNPVHLAKVALDTNPNPNLDCFLYSDSDNADIVGRLTGGRRTFFLPLLGKPCKTADPCPADRPIDVFFSGNIRPSESLTTFIHGLGEPDVQVRNAIRKSVDTLIENRGKIPLLKTVSDCFREHGVARLEYRLLSQIDKFVRNYYRRNLISSLSGVTVDICGDVEDKHIAGMENVRLHGFRNFQHCLGMISHAKITLGDSINFTNGIDLRLAMAMSGNSLYADAENQFIANYFRDDESMIVFRHDASDASEKIRSCLEDDGRRMEMSGRAASIYDRNLTWDAWVDRILGIADDYWRSA